jgi:hypothetical protein
MAKKQICPTCELEQPESRAPLAYFAGIGVSPATVDSIACAFHETSRLIAFLSAAAVVGALAATQHGHDSDEDPEWLWNWTFLVEELESEATRRVRRLQKVAELWRTRAKQGKE